MSAELDRSIDAFLAGSPHVVIGASRQRKKYGNKVLRAYVQAERPVFAVNPYAREVEGMPAYPDLAHLPEAVHGISVITPPEITEIVIAEAFAAGVRHVWMQPGAESARAVAAGHASGMNVIAGGPCLLVVLGFRESR